MGDTERRNSLSNLELRDILNNNLLEGRKNIIQENRHMRKLKGVEAMLLMAKESTKQEIDAYVKSIYECIFQFRCDIVKDLDRKVKEKFQMIGAMREGLEDDIETLGTLCEETEKLLQFDRDIRTNKERGQAYQLMDAFSMLNKFNSANDFDLDEVLKVKFKPTIDVKDLDPSVFGSLQGSSESSCPTESSCPVSLQSCQISNKPIGVTTQPCPAEVVDNAQSAGFPSSSSTLPATVTDSMPAPGLVKKVEMVLPKDVCPRKTVSTGTASVDSNNSSSSSLPAVATSDAGAQSDQNNNTTARVSKILEPDTSSPVFEAKPVLKPPPGLGLQPVGAGQAKETGPMSKNANISDNSASTSGSQLAVADNETAAVSMEAEVTVKEEPGTCSGRVFCRNMKQRQEQGKCQEPAAPLRRPFTVPTKAGSKGSTAAKENIDPLWHRIEETKRACDDKPDSVSQSSAKVSENKVSEDKVTVEGRQAEVNSMSASAATLEKSPSSTDRNRACVQAQATWCKNWLKRTLSTEEMRVNDSKSSGANIENPDRSQRPASVSTSSQGVRSEIKAGNSSSSQLKGREAKLTCSKSVSGTGNKRDDSSSKKQRLISSESWDDEIEESAVSKSTSTSDKSMRADENLPGKAKQESSVLVSKPSKRLDIGASPRKATATKKAGDASKAEDHSNGASKAAMAEEKILLKNQRSQVERYLARSSDDVSASRSSKSPSRASRPTRREQVATGRSGSASSSRDGRASKKEAASSTRPSASSYKDGGCFSKKDSSDKENMSSSRIGDTSGKQTVSFSRKDASSNRDVGSVIKSSSSTNQGSGSSNKPREFLVSSKVQKPARSVLMNLFTGGRVVATGIKTVGRHVEGRGNGFHFPIGVATNSLGHLIVADTGNHLVKVFDGDKMLYVLGAECAPSFHRPSAIVVNDEDTIFVKDDVCVRKFSRDGTFMYNIGFKKFIKPFGLALIDNDQLMVLDTNRQYPQLIKFTQTGEAFNFHFYCPLNGAPSQSKCRFMAVSDSKVIVSDLGLSRIYVTDLKGQPLMEFGQPGLKPREFVEPAGITTDKFGNFLIADSKNNRIQVFNREGFFVCIIEFQEAVVRPSGIHLDGNKLYIVNFLHHHIRVFTLSTQQALARGVAILP